MKRGKSQRTFVEKGPSLGSKQDLQETLPQSMDDVEAQGEPTKLTMTTRMIIHDHHA